MINKGNQIVQEIYIHKIIECLYQGLREQFSAIVCKITKMKEFFGKYNLIYQELKNEVNHSLTRLTIFTRTKSRILEVKLKFIFHSLTIA